MSDLSFKDMTWEQVLALEDDESPTVGIPPGRIAIGTMSGKKKKPVKSDLHNLMTALRNVLTKSLTPSNRSARGRQGTLRSSVRKSSKTRPSRARKYS